jgi:hypothetical protein
LGLIGSSLRVPFDAQGIKIPAPAASVIESQAHCLDIYPHVQVLKN